jgi:MFS family permease
MTRTGQAAFGTVATFLRTATAKLRTAVREVRTGGTGWLLVLISTGWSLSIGVRFVYPALLPFVRSEFGFGLSTAGLLLTCLWGAYAVGHVPGGVLGDRFGEGTVLVWSVVVSTAAVLLVAAAPTVGVLFCATVAFGLATALYDPMRFAILTDLYPSGSGSAVGVTMAAGNVANTTFPVVATALTGALGWRFGVAAFAPLFGLIAVGLWTSVPARTSSDDDALAGSPRAILARLRDGVSVGAIPTFVAIQLSLSFVIQGFTSFYPLYLTDVKGLSPGIAATLFGGFFALGAVVQPISGRLADRLGTKPTLVGFLSVCVVPLWLLPFVDGLVPLVAATVAFAAWNGTVVVTQTYVAETLPAALQGTGFGTLKAGWMLFGATAPLLVGLLADAGFFDAGFLLLGAVGTAGVALAVWRL